MEYGKYKAIMEDLALYLSAYERAAWLDKGKVDQEFVNKLVKNH